MKSTNEKQTGIRYGQGSEMKQSIRHICDGHEYLYVEEVANGFGCLRNNYGTIVAATMQNSNDDGMESFTIYVGSKVVAILDLGDDAAYDFGARAQTVIQEYVRVTPDHND